MFRIAACQLTPAPEREARRTQMQTILTKVQEEGIDFLCFLEGFLTGYYEQDYRRRKPYGTREMMKTKQPHDLKVALEEYLLQHIPISSAMGVRVEVASADQIVLKAPFSNNINHKKTVFGGSLHAVATLACWSLLHVNLVDVGNVQIVIASSEVSYLAPVISDFKTECRKPADSEWERFIKTLQKRGKARLRLCATIFQEGLLCVDYSGLFVAIKTGVLQ